LETLFSLAQAAGVCAQLHSQDSADDDEVTRSRTLASSSCLLCVRPRFAPTSRTYGFCAQHHSQDSADDELTLASPSCFAFGSHHDTHVQSSMH
jgi:hypothetical protein